MEQTPQQYADELIEKYEKIIGHLFFTNQYVKECAIIDVQNTINALFGCVDSLDRIHFYVKVALLLTEHK